MNEREKQNEKLLIWADYIDGMIPPPTPDFFLTDSVELVVVDKKTRFHILATFRPWLLDFLPGCFDEWHYHEITGNPTFFGCDEEAGTVAAVVDFFGLSHEEFCHCFCFDYELPELDKKFGGEKLTEESQCSDIARNIVELVRRRK